MTSLNNHHRKNDMTKLARQIKKRKQRETKVKRQKRSEKNRRIQAVQKRWYQFAYPELRIDTANSDPDFTREVEKAVATIDFEDRSVFREWETDIFCTLKLRGVSAMRDMMLSLSLGCFELGVSTGDLFKHYIEDRIGQIILDRISNAVRERCLPTNFMQIAPHKDRIQITCQSLLRSKDFGGSAYYSNQKPTLDIEGEQKIVAFSKHAMDQIISRVMPDSMLEYPNLRMMFSFLNQEMYCESCELHKKHLGFIVYQKCCPDSEYVKEILGEDELDSTLGTPYAVLGYCPAVIVDEFAKAKTLLLPGYSSTPEYGSIFRHANSYIEREELIAKTQSWERNLDSIEDAYDLLKWFHDHGVSQIIQVA